MPTLAQTSRCIIAVLLLMLAAPANSCTIFMANDGQHVWIGNNEDELQQLRYRFWYYPARKSSYGYCIWTELPKVKWLQSLSYLNPQGGLNAYGLFLDYTAIDKTPLVLDRAKPKRKKEVVRDILKQCKTVDEALEFLSRYNLVRLNQAQLFIGDASGNYAVVAGGRVYNKTEACFVLTNYSPDKAPATACHRRDAVARDLKEAAIFDLNAMVKMLEKSAQKPPNNLISNYSMAVDLKSCTLYLYYKTDFRTPLVLHLRDELEKGKHHRDIDRCFPKNIAPALERMRRREGIHAALKTYADWRAASVSDYTFNNRDAMDLAVDWLEKGLNAEALLLLQCLLSFEPDNADLCAWLGVAYRLCNDIGKSDSCFHRVLQQHPDHYTATLWGAQQNGKVLFKLPDFEGAQQVSLMGDFSEWTRHPLPMKKESGYWTCTVNLPRGVVSYKFLVNDQYLADSSNRMHTGAGPRIFSKLYVW